MKFIETTERHAFFDAFHAGIRQGKLHVITPENSHITFEGDKPGFEATWHILDWEVVDSLISRGGIGLGETYSRGLWETDNLENLFKIFIQNIDNLNSYANGHKLSRVWFYILNNILRRNNIRGSSSNIRSHYDVGNDFYKLWLDDSMTYSSALYDGKSLTLEEAQKNKYDRILNRITTARKNILEIGCGWGGFAEKAADRQHHVTALTISPSQFDFAKNRLKNKSANILLKDYRQIKDKFDSIASIEMFEAVGKEYWPAYFKAIKNCLNKDGTAMVQTITIKDDLFDGYIKRSDYIRHYVFPGGLLPSVKQFKLYAERAGMVCHDIFNFGLDYAETLRQWLTRFETVKDKIRLLGYDESFIRSWRLYMTMCAASFACRRTDVVQIEMQHA